MLLLVSFLFYIFFLLQRIFIFIIYSPLYSFNQLEFLFMAISCLSSVLYTVQNDVSCSERTEQHCAQFFLAYTIIISLRTGKALFRILFGQLRWLKDKVLWKFWKVMYQLVSLFAFHDFSRLNLKKCVELFLATFSLFRHFRYSDLKSVLGLVSRI